MYTRRFILTFFTIVCILIQANTPCATKSDQDVSLIIVANLNLFYSADFIEKVRKENNAIFPITPLVIDGKNNIYRISVHLESGNVNKKISEKTLTCNARHAYKNAFLAILLYTSYSNNKPNSFIITSNLLNDKSEKTVTDMIKFFETINTDCGNKDEKEPNKTLTAKEIRDLIRIGTPKIAKTDEFNKQMTVIEDIDNPLKDINFLVRSRPFYLNVHYFHSFIIPVQTENGKQWINVFVFKKSDDEYNFFVMDSSSNNKTCYPEISKLKDALQFIDLEIKKDVERDALSSSPTSTQFSNKASKINVIVSSPLPTGRMPVCSMTSTSPIHSETSSCRISSVAKSMAASTICSTLLSPASVREVAHLSHSSSQSSSSSESSSSSSPSSSSSSSGTISSCSSFGSSLINPLSLQVCSGSTESESSSSPTKNINNEISCPKCSKKYPIKEIYNHLQTTHVNKLYCKKCFKPFELDDKKGLSQHMRRPHCLLCFSKFKTGKNGNYYGSICGNLTELKKHLLQNHKKNVPYDKLESYSVPIDLSTIETCFRIYDVKDVESLKRHERKLHCFDCRDKNGYFRLFKTVPDYQDHRVNVHGATISTITVPPKKKRRVNLLPKNVTNSLSSSVGSSSLSTVAEPVYILSPCLSKNINSEINCPTCSKKYPIKEMLNHIETTHVTKYYCNKCLKTFELNERDNLLEHTRRTHCLLCFRKLNINENGRYYGTTLGDLKQLKQHLLNKHGIDATEDELKSYCVPDCGLCSIEVSKVKSLTEKKLKIICSSCKERISLEDMKNHCKSDHSGKKYCKICYRVYDVEKQDLFELHKKCHHCLDCIDSKGNIRIFKSIREYKNHREEVHGETISPMPTSQATVTKYVSPKITLASVVNAATSGIQTHHSSASTPSLPASASLPTSSLPAATSVPVTSMVTSPSLAANKDGAVLPPIPVDGKTFAHPLDSVSIDDFNFDVGQAVGTGANMTSSNGIDSFAHPTISSAFINSSSIHSADSVGPFGGSSTLSSGLASGSSISSYSLDPFSVSSSNSMTSCTTLGSALLNSPIPSSSTLARRSVDDEVDAAPAQINLPLPTFSFPQSVPLNSLPYMNFGSMPFFNSLNINQTIHNYHTLPHYSVAAPFASAGMMTYLPTVDIPAIASYPSSNPTVSSSGTVNMANVSTSSNPIPDVDMKYDLHAVANILQ